MMALYWAQIRAVIRLEMKKTFFSRRGLWVYLVAFAPVLMFGAHAFDMMRSREYRHEMAAAHPASKEALESIKHGMTREEVIAKLGEPASQRSFENRRHTRSWLTYTDGESEYGFNFVDDELEGISIHGMASLNEDKLIFATVFQFFFLRLAIFFGCVGIFMNLFRGELIDKSLHYY